jgi:hypothetical protein
MRRVNGVERSEQAIVVSLFSRVHESGTVATGHKPGGLSWHETDGNGADHARVIQDRPTHLRHVLLKDEVEDFEIIDDMAIRQIHLRSVRTAQCDPTAQCRGAESISRRSSDPPAC